MEATLTEDNLSTSISVPGNLAFRNPLLLTLGLATNLTPNVYVPAHTLIPKVIEAAGYDLGNLAQYGSPEAGWSLLENDPHGLPRKVILSYRFAHYHRKDPLTVEGTRGQWALTAAGVEAAMDMILAEGVQINLRAVESLLEAPSVVPCEEAPAPEPVITKRQPKTYAVANMTARYLDKRIRETGGHKGTLMSCMRRAVSSHLPVSSTTGLVEDHIQNCFMRLIQRDSLADRIIEDSKISDHALASFAVRAGYTDIRDWGTDPVCREMYGARTESERAKGLVLPPSSDTRVVWAADEDSNTAAAWSDIADESASMEEVLNFQQVWEQIAEVLHANKPHVSDRYLKILKMRADGCTMKDIAERENVSPFRAAALMAEVRRVLRSVGVDEMVQALA